MTREIPQTVIVGASVVVIVIAALYLFTNLPTGGETAKVQKVSYTGGDKCATVMPGSPQTLPTNMRLARWPNPALSARIAML